MTDKTTLAKALTTLKLHCVPKSLESKWHYDRTIRLIEAELKEHEEAQEKEV